jgi:cation transport ATPase
MRHPPVSRAPRDLLLLTITGALVFVVLTTLEVFAHLATWLHAQQLVDDLVSLVLVVVGGAIFSWRRWRELQAARGEIRMLSGVIRICAWCRKARHPAGSWISLEDYVRGESDAGFF